MPIKKFEPSDGHHRNIADANCFYFSTLNLTELCREMLHAEQEIAVRWGRIEVSDKDGPLHWHQGATLVYIAAGHGIVRTEKDTIPVRAGDCLYIPAGEKHLSIAAPHTTLIEMITYFGTTDDMQAVQE